MKNLFYLLFIASSISCSTNPVEQAVPKMVPDNTPYIAALIEASYDTTHHYPEVVVGYFTDNFTDRGDRAPREIYEDLPNILLEYPGIYNPTLHQQVVKTSILFGLSYKPENDAIVTVQGPIGTSKERTVTFVNEGKGVYGDQTFALARIPNGIYTLRVELSDGRKYTSTTQIPEKVRFSISDSISINVIYKPFGDGTPKEEDTGQYQIIGTQPSNSFLTIIQSNSNIDKDLFFLEPNEEFHFADRSNYLRVGSFNGIYFTNLRTNSLLTRGWIQNLDKPREDIWMSSHYWLRFSYFSDGIGNMFHPLGVWFASSEKWTNEIHEPAANAAAANDSTYLFDVSTILKVGDDGEILPKEASDAIGFFGGYFSIYRQTTMYPDRQFDLDSVLTAAGNE